MVETEDLVIENVTVSDTGKDLYHIMIDLKDPREPMTTYNWSAKMYVSGIKPDLITGLDQVTFSRVK
jgi:hypothetical protein